MGTFGLPLFDLARHAIANHHREVAMALWKMARLELPVLVG
ncbi:MAG TPA: hypothetical protein VGJ78_03370 [Vicinamibacterales bacterium]|jgi:hypothetical protein